MTTKEDDGTNTTPIMDVSVCDYLVIGGGATGMAFCDTLLATQTMTNQAKNENNNTTTTTSSSSSSSSLQIVILDQHAFAGGHWHDSYDFVRLHQPSSMYGVETRALEKEASMLATKQEILNYYRNVQTDLETRYGLCFIPYATFDFNSKKTTIKTTTREIMYSYTIAQPNQNKTMETITKNIVVRKRLVDARYLQPDIPANTPAKFTWNPDYITCVPVNELVHHNNNNNDNNKIANNVMTTTTTHGYNYYVIVGAGKTGMDAIIYLLTEKHVPSNHIVWVVPHEAWITAREHVGNCMEFLYNCWTVAQQTSTSTTTTTTNKNPTTTLLDHVHTNDFLQNGFLEWEKQGKIYRIGKNDDHEILPTQFKDATLDQKELDLLQSITQIVRNGHVQSIDNDGTIQFTNGQHVTLPWKEKDNNNNNKNDLDMMKQQILFVHCTAGAFQYTKRLPNDSMVVPIFQKDLIQIQDVYGTPGFCFVGSIIGRLENLTDLSDNDRNQMCLCPAPITTTKEWNDKKNTVEQQQQPPSSSGGMVGTLTSQHNWIQRLCNVRQWYQHSIELQTWLVSNRLFHLYKVPSQEILPKLDEIYHVFVQAGLIVATTTTTTTT